MVDVGTLPELIELRNVDELSRLELLDRTELAVVGLPIVGSPDEAVLLEKDELIGFGVLSGINIQLVTKLPDIVMLLLMAKPVSKLPDIVKLV